MPSFNTLDIVGFHDLPVPNTFIRQDDATTHLAVILPGFGYQASMPVLYYPGIMLLDHGADVLNVEYSYSHSPQFLEAPTEERELWLSRDVSASLQEGLLQRGYTRITLIGKSLGTVAIGHLLESEDRVKGAQCIWLTPLLKNERLLSQITSTLPRSLFIIGTADDHYDRKCLEKAAEVTSGESVVIEGADHSLEIKGDIVGTIDAMRRVVREIDKFVSI